MIRIALRTKRRSEQKQLSVAKMFATSYDFRSLIACHEAYELQISEAIDLRIGSHDFGQEPGTRRRIVSAL